MVKFHYLRIFPLFLCACEIISGAVDRTLAEDPGKGGSTSSSESESSSGSGGNSFSSQSSSSNGGSSTSSACGEADATGDGVMMPDSWTPFCSNGEMQIDCTTTEAIGQDGASPIGLPSYSKSETFIRDERTLIYWMDTDPSDEMELSSAIQYCDELGGELPTRKELIALFDYGQEATQNTAHVCNNYFDKLTGDSFWLAPIESNQWVLSMDSGMLSVSEETTAKAICRSSSAAFDSTLVSTTDNLIVHDEVTNTDWYIGETAVAKDWTDAIEYCQTLSYDNGGWYLPTIKELQLLVVTPIEEGSLFLSDLFMDAIADDDTGFWSSTPQTSNPAMAWITSFTTAEILPSKTTTSHSVVCVRQPSP